MKCLNCQKEIGGVKFCPFCGTIQDKDKYKQELQIADSFVKQNIKGIRKVFISFVILLVVVVSAVSIVSIYDTKKYGDMKKQLLESPLVARPLINNTVSLDAKESNIEAKISFFTDYFNRYEVEDKGDERYNFYTDDMRHNRIDIGSLSTFSLAEEEVGIYAPSLSVTHDKGNWFIVSYHGDDINAHGNIPSVSWTVEIIEESGSYKINNICFKDVTSGLFGKWMANRGAHADYVFCFNRDGKGYSYEISTPDFMERENGEKTTISSPEYFKWTSSDQLIKINYYNGENENVNIDEKGCPWWSSAFEDKSEWCKIANL